VGLLDRLQPDVGEWDLVVPAFDVDVHDLIVRLFSLVRQRSRRLLDAGVVEGAIEPAECRQCPVDDRFDIALFRDVGCDEDGFAAQTAGGRFSSS
jgi:hypothetical protein